MLALHKPNSLIPLSKNDSRGDLILNARSFEKQGFSYVIEEEDLTDNSFLRAVSEVWNEREAYRVRMANSRQLDAITTITDLIEEEATKGRKKK